MTRLEDQIMKAKEYGFSEIVLPLLEAERALEALKQQEGYKDTPVKK